MITFSNEQISFTYVENQHLVTTLAIRNNTTNKHLYYKFRVSRQRYYMVKPDRNYIKPAESTVVHITIHKEGIPLSSTDQFQLLYAFYDIPQRENYSEMFRAPAQFESKKFGIVVSGARHLTTSGASPGKDSRMMESLANTQRPPENTIQTKIETHENRIRELQEEIGKYKTIGSSSSNSPQKPKSAWKSWLFLGFVGVAVGYVAGLYIG